MSEDPTYVPLDDIDPRKDPLQVLEHGWTRHKNIEICCPYISPILPNLYMGGTDPRLVMPASIDYCLSLYKWEVYKVEHELREEKIVTMYDAEDEPDLPAIMELAEWVHQRRQRGTVLVLCQAGLNRSGLVTATALTLDGYTGREAIDLLRERRSPAVLCNQAFEDFVLGLT